MKNVMIFLVMMIVVCFHQGCTSLEAKVSVFDSALYKADHVDIAQRELYGEALAGPHAQRADVKSRLADIAANRKRLDDKADIAAFSEESSGIALQERRNLFDQTVSAARSAGVSDVTIDVVEKKAEAPGGVISNLDFDPNASVIAHAPDRYWRSCSVLKNMWEGRSYDKAIGRGWIGNTDIAIVQDAEMKFTVKGLRVDGSKVPTLTLSLTRQLMAVAAAMQGVAVKLPGAQGTADSDFDFTADLVKLETKRAADEAKVLRSKQAMLQMLDAIGKVKAEDLRDDALRKAAIERIQKMSKEVMPVVQMK